MNTSNSDTPDTRPGSLTESQMKYERFIRTERMVSNIMSMRREMFDKLLDPRRDIDKECGYPKGRATPVQFQDLFDRDPIANRVVRVWPRECWQVQPLVYESEDASEITQFEQSLDDIGKRLTGTRSWYKDYEGNPLWEYVQRLDEISGIGQFGVMLLGIDDGLALDRPAMMYTDSGQSYPQDARAEGTEGQYGGPFTNPLPGETSAVKKSAILEDSVPESESLGMDNYDDDTMSLDEDALASDDSDVDDVDTGVKRRLLFVRVFPQSLVHITQFETNPNSPRYQQPVMYSITFNDPKDSQGGIGFTTTTRRVHWTRVVHVADNPISNEWLGKPRMEPVLNRLMDLQKLYGGSAEMYWKGAFFGLSFETHPQLGGEVEIDKAALKDTMEEFFNGLQRGVATRGMTANVLAPAVVDPTPQIMVQVEAICIQLAIPKRIFMGSERGELASTQDDEAWNDRLRLRQKSHISPRVIAPVIDRLITLGILPIPEEYCIEWPDISSQTRAEKAGVAVQQVTALSQYIAGNGESLITPLDFLTRFLMFTEEEAMSILEASGNAITPTSGDVDTDTETPSRTIEASGETVEPMPIEQVAEGMGIV